MSHTRVSDEDFQFILRQVRDFVRNDVVPREVEIMRENAMPDDIRRAAAEMGLFGYAVPEEWGGLGLDLTQDVELAMEFGYTTLSLRSMFGTNNGIAGQVLVGFGTDEQRKTWLERIASGDVVASFALTEPGAGSNPAGLKTRARRDGTDWVIDGSKQFITNAPVADLFVVFARTRDAQGEDPGIAVFLVPADSPGLTVGPKDLKMGQEGSLTSTVTFDGVRVPAEALVGGGEAIGYKAAMTSLARGRVHIAALAVGTAQRALDESVAYAAAHTQGGERIGDFQLVQAMLADQQTGVLAGRSMVDAARAYVSGEDRRIAPSAVKLFCTEMVGKVADLAVQVHGGAGYMREIPVERIYRDVRLLPALRGHQRDPEADHRRRAGPTDREGPVTALPLEDVTVVALEQAVAGPLVTRHPTDLGARVVTLERATAATPPAPTTPRCTASPALRVAEPGQGIARRQPHDRARAAGRARAAAPCGGLPAQHRARWRGAARPGREDAYGVGGPLEQRKAYDLLIQAESGMVSVTGTLDTATKNGVPNADIAAGLYSTTWVLGALFRRGRTGEGAVVDVSRFDAAVEWTGHPLYMWLYWGRQVPRMGLSHAAIDPRTTPTPPRRARSSSACRTSAAGGCSSLR